MSHSRLMSNMGCDRLHITESLRVNFKHWEGNMPNDNYWNKNFSQIFVVKHQLSPVGQLTIDVSKQIEAGSAAILKCWWIEKISG